MEIEIKDKETKERIGDIKINSRSSVEERLNILIAQNDIVINLLRKIGAELVGVHYK